MNNLRFPILMLAATVLCFASNYGYRSGLEYEIELRRLDRIPTQQLEPFFDENQSQMAEEIKDRLGQAETLQITAKTTRQTSILMIFLTFVLSLVSAVRDLWIQSERSSRLD